MTFKFTFRVDPVGMTVPYAAIADDIRNNSDVLYTASGGSITTFRYAVLYNSTPVNGNLIGFYDYSALITITSGNSFLVQFDAVNGVLTLQ